MTDFKSRLLQEKAQLDKKMDKLSAFKESEGFANIPPVQQTLLNIQIHAMATYSQVLLERIALMV